MNLKVKVIKEDDTFYLMVKPKESFEKDFLERIVGEERERNCILESKDWMKSANLNWEILQEVKELRKQSNRILKNWHDTLE